MKRVISILLILVMALGLTACTIFEPYETTIEVRGFGEQTFRVDPFHKTITNADKEYSYSVSVGWVQIVYPNGVVYREDPLTGSNSTRGTIDGMPGNVLVSVLTEEALSTAKEPWIVIVSAIFALMGLWHVLLPRKSLFMLAYGWGVWKAEESSANVRAIRLVGAVMMAAAVFCIVFA